MSHLITDLPEPDAFEFTLQSTKKDDDVRFMTTMNDTQKLDFYPLKPSFAEAQIAKSKGKKRSIMGSKSPNLSSKALR